MGLIEEGKSILDLVKKVQNRELYEKLSEYLDKVFSLTGDKVILQQQLADSVKRTEELEAALAFKGKVRRVEEVLQVVDDPTRFICMTCNEKDNKAYTLVDHGIRRQCPVCKNLFRDGRRSPGPTQMRTDYNPYERD